MCDNGPPGSSYCTHSPDYTCYLNGWPACCTESGGVNCPKTKPFCDNNRSGSSYCTYSADNSCYRNGWPKCCDAASGLTVRMFIFALSLYPPEPIISHFELSNEQCPLEQPMCDKFNPENYCRFSPDYNCYPATNGLPSCCALQDGINCPKTKPNCNLSSDETIASHYLRG